RELRRFLGARLPDHMVPAAFVRLDTLPLTTSGKVDHAALPAVGRGRPDVGELEPPSSASEELLAAVWSEVLGLDAVGVDDNFFATECLSDFSVYHDVFSFHLEGRFHRAALEQALAGLVARHPVLRTSLDLTSYSEPLQLVHCTARIPLQVVDARDLPAQQQEELLASWLEEERSCPLPWGDAPLVRVQVHL